MGSENLIDVLVYALRIIAAIPVALLLVYLYFYRNTSALGHQIRKIFAVFASALLFFLLQFIVTRFFLVHGVGFNEEPVRSIALFGSMAIAIANVYTLVAVLKLNGKLKRERK